MTWVDGQYYVLLQSYISFLLHQYCSTVWTAKASIIVFWLPAQAKLRQSLENKNLLKTIIKEYMIQH